MILGSDVLPKNLIWLKGDARSMDRASLQMCWAPWGAVYRVGMCQDTAFSPALGGQGGA